MGKLIAWIVTTILKIISYIPFIGMPLAKAISFLILQLIALFGNLFAFIKMLPYIIGVAIVIVMILSLMGVI